MFSADPSRQRLNHEEHEEHEEKRRSIELFFVFSVFFVVQSSALPALPGKLPGPMDSLPAPRSRLAHELKEMLRLALPLVTGQLSAIGMNVIDAMLAGHLDAHTLGAVAVGTSVWSLALVAAIGVMLALPPSVAQLNGAGRRPEIGVLFRQALWLALALGNLLLIGVHVGGPVLVRAISEDASLMPDVTRVLRAISCGLPAPFNCATDGGSESMTPIAATIASDQTLVPTATAPSAGKPSLPYMST
jgi:hypothetical protein